MPQHTTTTPAILITGGAGFIGCALAPSLLETGMPVVAIDSLISQVHPSGRWPEVLPSDVEMVRADVAEAGTWNAVLTRFSPELVVHLAAETGTGQSLTSSTQHARSNVLGTTAMLDAFVRHGVVPKHLVLTSSRAVYGEGPWLDADDQQFEPPPRSHRQLAAGQWTPRDSMGRPARPAPALAHSCHPNPSSVYGSTKLAQELILGNWASGFSAPLSIFRLQNVYGPGQSPHNPYTGIVTLFHRLASRGDVLDVYEDGDIGRDFVYIDDVVSALVAGVRRPPDSSRVLDVGSGRVTSILDAATSIARQHGAPTPIVSGRFRDGDVRSAWADIETSTRALDWHPQVDFDTGNARLAEWLLSGGFLG